MNTDRMGIFSDAVIAIILTIMVLELKVPHGVSADVLFELSPIFLSYILSFVYVGMYWINHHNLLHDRVVNGTVMWANLHLLFWLSLFPFVTGWMGQNHFAALPTAVYGGVLVWAAVAWWTLQRVLDRAEGGKHLAGWVEGGDWKPKLSISLYLAGIGAAAVDPGLGQLFFVAGALWWVWPDRRPA